MVHGRPGVHPREWLALGQRMIEYLATYGIWGISGPILAVIVPAIAYALHKGI